MIDPTNVLDVATNELLARYILQKSYVRADRSIKPNAFMPPSNLELSVTRHCFATEEELWSVGNDVAADCQKTLYGRGDVQASFCLDQSLSVKPNPITKNSNHAIICDWPNDKPAQKNIAQELAASAVYLEKP